MLRLPGEIRDKIYEEVLTGVEFEIYAFNSIPYRIHKGPVSKFAASLPCVCRQLYIDTSLLLYSKPTFTFPRFGLETSKRWASTLSPSQRQAIRTVKCWYYMRNEDFIGLFPSLKYLVAMKYTTSSQCGEEDLQSPLGIKVSIEYLDE